MLVLGIFPKDSTFFSADACSATFIAILFIITKNRKMLKSFTQGLDAGNTIHVDYGILFGGKENVWI